MRTLIHPGFTEDPAVSGLVLSAQHPGDACALRRNRFKHMSFLRPDYFVTGLSHPKKEVSVLGSRQCKSVIEAWDVSEDASSDQYVITGTGSPHRTRAMDSRLEKPTSLNPGRDILSKLGKHRTRDYVSVELNLGPKKFIQPESRRYLIVIYERYEVNRAGLSDGTISYMRNARPWLYHILDRPRNRYCRADFGRAREFVVIHGHYLYLRFLYFAEP